MDILIKQQIMSYKQIQMYVLFFFFSTIDNEK